MAGNTDKRARREKGTGTIYKKPDSDTWVGKLDVGTTPEGKRKYKYFSGKTEAEVKKRIRDFVKAGESVDTNKTSVQTYIYNWLANYKRNTIKESSYDTLEKTVRNYIVPHLGSYHLSQLTSDDIQRFLQKLKDDGYSYSTVKKAYNCLNEVLKHATIRKDIQDNPMLVVNMLSTESFEKKEIRFFDEKECALIVEEARRKYSTGRDVYAYGDAYILIMNTGLRLGELLGLEKEDWNKEAKTIHVKRNVQFVRKRGSDGKVTQGRQRIVNSTKTYSGDRVIPLNDNATEAMERLCAKFPDNRYVVSTSKGTMASHQYIERTFDFLLENIGIDKASPHSLRHTFASVLFSQGVDVKTVSELLGHASIQITLNTYVHLIGKPKHSAVETLDKII